MRDHGRDPIKDGFFSAGRDPGETKGMILKAYPYLESEDIDEALRFAAYMAEDETIELGR